MMKKILLLPLLWLLGMMPAMAQTTPFSTYVLGLAAITSPTGAEKMVAISAGTPKTLTPNQILAFVSGDCTIAAPPSIVCTKTGGVAFAASATTNTTNATNISSGTLALTRLALTSAFFYVGNGSANPAGVAMSGDCTLANTGAVTCTKTGGVTFATSATTDTTSATNITSGTLAAARYAQANLAASGNGGVGGVLPFSNMPTGSLDSALGYWSSTTLAATAIPNCTAGALQYNTTTHVFACNVGGGSGNVTNSGVPTNGQIAQWISSTQIKGVAITTLATINVVKVVTFTSSGTYTPSTGLQYAIIECVGGGAGGGGLTDPGAGNGATTGSGGTGAYSRSLASAATIGGSQVVTIGNAGSGGGVGASGNAGATTSVGAICIAPGGLGGGGGPNGAAGAGGAAGTGNMVASPGRPGGVGSNQAIVTVTQRVAGGGSSEFGAGGPEQVIAGTAVNGTAASGFGSGGGASGSQNGSGSAAGGNGTPGYVVVTEFTNQ